MIYDCFIFDDELMMLEIRLNALDSVVDKFVLVEAPHTFRGNPKSLHYYEHKNDPALVSFKNKILHVICDFPVSQDTRVNEKRQRACVVRDCMEDDDIIFICDVDEIWKPGVATIYAQMTCPAGLNMVMYRYAFNCRYGNWRPSMVSRAKDLALCGDFRNITTQNRIPDAGWHYSYLMKPKEIARKLGRFGHSEFDCEPYTTIEYLTDCIAKRQDMFKRGIFLEVVPLDAPDYVMQNMERFKEFIF